MVRGKNKMNRRTFKMVKLSHKPVAGDLLDITRDESLYKFKEFMDKYGFRFAAQNIQTKEIKYFLAEYDYSMSTNVFGPSHKYDFEEYEL